MLRNVLPLVAAAGLASAVTIAEINGDAFLSPLNGTKVEDVKGLVTAKNAQGVFVRSTEPDDDDKTSESIFLFNRDVTSLVKVGDLVTFDATVEEYRSNNLHNYLTELTKPANVKVVSSDNEVTPLVLGDDTASPPTELFSSLDEGGIFGVPNDVARISAENPTLQPEKYGMDFWESLVGELVTIKDVVQVSRPNTYGDVWVRSDSLKSTGVNSHGGLTMLEGDANPEAITIGSPLDGTSNPSDTKMGDELGDVTGIVYNAFGFYRILPLTAVSPIKNATTDSPPLSFNSTGDCRGMTIGSYNAENLNPQSAHLPGVIDQIIEKLLTPDVLFLQEVQDGSGDANDGVVSGNLTLQALSEGIEKKSGVVYEWAEVEPINNMDGGAPGGNIRCAYLYRADTVELYNPNQGGPNDKTEVVTDDENPNWPTLSFNPGRIEPDAEAWDNSRKPLVAQWKPLKGTGKTFFTVNVHFGSKGGSSSLHGDPRPPVNKGVEKRETQAEITADFIAEILSKDPNARIITAGDFNEFTQVAPLQTFMSRSSLVDLDEAAGVDPAERYTYLFDMNSQQLDHIFVSEGTYKKKGAQLEHLHLNTWQNYDDQVSDHDPSVARFNLCGCA